MTMQLLETVQLVELDLIKDNPYQEQGRRAYRNIEELARTIAADDLQEKPKARMNGNGVELQFGHRRREAFKWLRDNWHAQGLPDRYQGYSVMPLEIEDATDEQMFRRATIENAQRDDLNVIETARLMQFYMDTFGKTSDEVGELFGVAGVTVRAKTRLLDLPQEIQVKLADGTISENTARSLLSMQKIAPMEAVISAVADIEKNEDDELPEVVIDRAIESLDETVDMWNDNHRDGGKPRSHWRYGWLLDMKNFPNKLLPALTPVDAAIALGIQDDQVKMETIAVWMETSVAPTVDQALDELKDRGFDDDLLDRLRHLFNPPACTACQFYTKVRGSHYCGMKVCYTRKMAAWHLNKIQDASRQLKIKIYQEEDGKRLTLDYDDEKLFESRHEGLRLISRDQVNGYPGQYGFKGVDHDMFVVVATGGALEKLKKVKQGNASSATGPAARAEQKAKRIYRIRRKELLWEFTQVGLMLFDRFKCPMLQKIQGWKFMGVDDHPLAEAEVADNAKVDTEKAEYYRRLIIWKLTLDGIGYEAERRTQFSKIVARLEKLCQEWGVKMPKTIRKMAEQFEAEVEAVASEVPASKSGKK